MFWFRFVVAPDDGSDVVDNLRTIGALILWAAAVLTALTVIAKFDITRLPGGVFVQQLWRRNVTVPLMVRRHRRIQGAVEPLFREMRDENTAQHEENADRLEQIAGSIDVVRSEVVVLSGEVLKLTVRADAVEDALTTPTPKEHDH